MEAARNGEVGQDEYRSEGGKEASNVRIPQRVSAEVELRSARASEKRSVSTTGK
jgi:hypothetical protein